MDCFCLARVLFGREWGSAPWRVGYGKMRVLCGTGVGGAVPVLDDGACAGGDLARGGGAVRVLAGSRPAGLVVLVTIAVVRDTPPDRHFSAWSRPKPAPDPLPGPSVASGVIPTKGGKNGSVPATSGRAPAGRWRSSPWKRCNHAPPRGRGQGAPRTARCIKTTRAELPRSGPSRQGAPRTARCIKTVGDRHLMILSVVREHPAPLGALRP